MTRLLSLVYGQWEYCAPEFGLHLDHLDRMQAELGGMGTGFVRPLFVRGQVDMV